MSRQLEVQQEIKQQKINTEIVAAVEFDLVGSIAVVGGKLLGFSVKIGVVDCLLTLRADFEGQRMVCFVGAPDIGGCLRKSVVEAHSNGLRWREDSFVK